MIPRLLRWYVSLIVGPCGCLDTCLISGHFPRATLTHRLVALVVGVFISPIYCRQRCCVSELYGEPLVLVSALLGQCHCGSAALGGQLCNATAGVIVRRAFESEFFVE